LAKGSSLRVVLGGVLALALLNAMNAGYTNVLGLIKSELELSYSWSGGLMSSYFLGYTLGQVPWGVASDRWGPRRIMAASVLGISLSTALFSVAYTPLQAAATRFIGGLLGAGVFVPSVKLVSAWFNEENRGSALGALSVGGSLGLIVVSWAAPLLAGALGWRRALASIGWVGATLSPVCYLLLEDKPSQPKAGGLPQKTVIRSLSTLAIIHFIRLGTYYTVVAWLPLLLREEAGLNPATISVAVSLLSTAGILANPIGGLLSDRVGETKTLAAGFALLALSVALFALGSQGPLLLLQVFVLGWFINFHRSPSFTIIPKLYGPEEAGSLSGVLNTFASLGALAMPFTLGLIRDTTQSYALGWGLVAALSLAAAIASTRIEVD